MALHSQVVLILILVKLGLIDAGLGVQSILIQITLLIELLVDICSLHKVVLDESLLESTTYNRPVSEAFTALSPACSFWCCHQPPVVVQTNISGDKGGHLAVQLIVLEVRVRCCLILFIRGVVFICEFLPWLDLLLFAFLNDLGYLLGLFGLNRGPIQGLVSLELVDVKNLVHGLLLDDFLLEIRNIVR